MSVKATTTVSTSPRSTCEASASRVNGALFVRGSVNTLLARSRDEAREQVSCPRQVARQLFGVALHGDDQAVIGLDALDGAVLAMSRLMQTVSELLHRLVMEAVDPNLVLACGVHYDIGNEVAVAKSMKANSPPRRSTPTCPPGESIVRREKVSDASCNR